MTTDWSSLLMALTSDELARLEVLREAAEAAEETSGHYTPVESHWDYPSECPVCEYEGALTPETTAALLSMARRMAEAGAVPDLRLRTEADDAVDDAMDTAVALVMGEARERKTQAEADLALLRDDYNRLLIDLEKGNGHIKALERENLELLAKVRCYCGDMRR